MDYVVYIICDILLGFVPQAIGCAVCLFAMTKQRLRSKSFLITSLIFSAVAVIVRVICNYGIIEFGFHTILIWIIFAVIAITYNKLPVLQATVAIMMSGILIVVAELLTGGVLSLAFGATRFNEIMAYDITKNTEQEATLRAVCGIPMNILFVGISLLVYYIFRRRRMKAAQTPAVAEDAQ
jgi:lysylphosphatidylglycerol synthetase-like protein (DUF2156 family)